MSSAKLKKFDTMDSRSRGLLKDIMKRIDSKSFDLMKNPIFKSGRNFISQMMNPESEAYKRLEAPMRRQYSEEVVPHIAEQFAGADAMNSSAFNQALSRSAEGLEMNIAANREQAMQGAAQNALGYSQAPGYSYQNLVNMALGNQGFAYQAMPGSEGWGQGAFGGIAGAGGAILGSWGMSKLGGMFGGGAGGSATSSQMYAAENYLG